MMAKVVPPLRAGGLAFACLLSIAPAQAQDSAAMPGWHFDLTAYGWLQATRGSVRIDSISADIDSSFRDTVRGSDTLFALMLGGEARNGRLGLFFDAQYVRLGYDDVALGATTADVRNTVGMLELGAAWQVAGAPEGGWALDVLAGARWTRLRSEFALPVAPFDIDQKVDWVDPIIGLRLRGSLSPRWSYVLRGDIGGFGVGSDFAWQAAAELGYRFALFGHPAAAVAGYRVLAQDYDGTRLAWDMTLHGPVLGLRMRF